MSGQEGKLHRYKRHSKKPRRYKEIRKIDTLILAALDLTNCGASVFTAADLTVSAWSRNRMMFGLSGYEQTYPDHNKVVSALVGTVPTSVLSQGFLKRVGRGCYKLTDKGVQAAIDLRNGLGRHHQEDSPDGRREKAHQEGLASV